MKTYTIKIYNKVFNDFCEEVDNRISNFENIGYSYFDLVDFSDDNSYSALLIMKKEEKNKKIKWLLIRDRLINIDSIIKFSIEEDSRTGKFRIFCDTICAKDSVPNNYLEEWNTFNEAMKSLFELRNLLEKRDENG